MKLPPLERRFLDTISRYGMISAGEKILVALSGGSDSVCLLRLLCKYKEALCIEICAAHVNHMIRGAEADADEEFARSLCRELGVDVYCQKTDVPFIAKEKGEGIEECARNIRYEFFERISKDIRADKIAVAHNASDRSETFIFNLCRGSGVSGLRSISPKRDRIIRPLIDSTKEEIEAYCGENAFEYKVDSTNADTDYTRNRIRHKVLPVLREFSRDFDKAVAVSCDNLAEAEDFTSNCALDFINANCKNGRLPTAELENIHPYLAKRVINLLFVAFVGNNSKDRLSKAHLEAAYRLLKQTESGHSVDMPGGIKFVKEQHYAYFTDGSTVGIPETEIFLGTNNIGTLTVTAELFHINASDAPEIIYTLFKQAFIDCDKIVGRIRLRSRKSGDTIRAEGITKSIKEYFINKKIPLSERESYPLICDDEGIIWVPSMSVADRVKIGADTKKVINIKIKE